MMKNHNAIGLILAVTLLSVIGVPSIVPVFPEMAESLNVSRGKIGLMITVFTLPGAVLAPMLGMIIDRYGRKRILIPALLLFGVSGSACYFAATFEIMLTFRFFQGLGAAGLGIINITLIGDMFSGNEKVKVMGYNSGVMSAGMALFPAFGGLLATFHWRYPFLIPLLALIVALLVLRFLDNPEPQQKARFSHYLRNAFKSVISKKAIVLFLLTFTTFLLLFGVVMTYMPILLKDRFGLSSSEIGLMISFMALTAGTVAAFLNRIAKILSMKALISSGLVAFLIGFAGIPFVDNFYVLLFLMLIIGIGQGINIPTIFNILTSISPLEHRGAFMSVNSMTIRAGQTMGPLFAGIIFGLWGLSWVFWVAAISATLFVIILMLFSSLLSDL
jgi:MFS family permease